MQLRCAADWPVLRGPGGEEISLCLKEPALPEARPAPAQRTPEAPPLPVKPAAQLPFRAVPAQARPAIDGDPSEAAWDPAPAGALAHQRFPRSGQPASERTSIKVVYDQDALYIAFSCEQRVPVVARPARRDEEVEADWVGFGIDVRGDGLSAFEFRVTAAGVLLDGRWRDDNKFSLEWNSTNWTARAAQTPTGWAAEMVIPLRDLPYVPRADRSWRMQARRHISQSQEDDLWAFIPRKDQAEVSRWRQLQGLELLPSRVRFTLVPYMRAGLTAQDLAGPEGVASALAGGFSGGLDLSLRAPLPRSFELTLSAALNPDFAQIEADPAVLLLANYEYLFDERRPFFLEGLEDMKAPLMLIYTRRIGRLPLAPSLRHRGFGTESFREVLVEPPAPAPIYGALKIELARGKWLTVSALSALSAPSKALLQEQVHGSWPLSPWQNAGRFTRVIEPLSLFNVLRIKAAPRRNAYLGFTGTATQRFEEPADYPVDWHGGPPGRLCPAGEVRTAGSRCYRDAYVAAVDGFWRPGAYELSGEGVASVVLDPGGRGLKAGTGGTLTLAKRDGGLRGWLGLTALSQGLDYSDLGFMNQEQVFGTELYLRQDLLQASAAIGLYGTRPWRGAQDWLVRLELYSRFSMERLALGPQASLGQAALLNTYWFLKSGWVLAAKATLHGGAFDDREVPGGPALERALRAGLQLAFNSDERRAVSGELWSHTEALHDASGWAGLRFRAMGRLTARVHRTVSVDLLPELLCTAGEVRHLPGQDQWEAAQRRFLFGRMGAQSASLTVRGTWRHPRLPLDIQLYAQLFLGAQRYRQLSSSTAGPGDTLLLDQLLPEGRGPTDTDSASAAVNLSAILRWDFRPGSALYLIYARTQTPDWATGLGQQGLDLGLFRRGPARDLLLLKLSYAVF